MLRLFVLCGLCGKTTRTDSQDAAEQPEVIASYTRDFIFLKTRKVGGTSLEIVLSAWCGEADICSPITAQDEVLRRAHGGKARNFRSPTGEILFYNHMPAAEVQAALPELWERAFKFTVDRHPYDKVISRAWWNVGRREGNPEQELSREIDRAIGSRSYLNYPIYTIGGELAVDEVWRYEDLWPRLARLAERLGVSPTEQQPKAKAGYRKDARSGAEILTTEQRAQVYRDARLEFDLLGYAP